MIWKENKKFRKMFIVTEYAALNADHTKGVCFVVCWNVKASLKNSVYPDQTAFTGAVWSGSTGFASLLTL